MHSYLHSNGDCLYFIRKLKDYTKGIEEILVFLKSTVTKKKKYLLSKFFERFPIHINN